MTNPKTKTPFDLKAFLKKQWSNIVFFAVIILFIIPSSRMVIQSQLASLFKTTPTAIEAKNREQLSDYNLVLKNLEGQTVNFNQSQDKPILINFWATWCAPCIAEMPDLNDLYQTFRNDVDFYFVSQENPEVLQKFLKSKNYDLPVFIQQTRLPKPLENNSIPSTYLINPQGKIIAKAKGAAKWNDDDIHQLIKKML